MLVSASQRALTSFVDRNLLRVAQIQVSLDLNFVAAYARPSAASQLV